MMEDIEMDEEAMEQEEEMEQEQEEGVEADEESDFTFVAVLGDHGRLEIDWDYEFDAPRFFDFCRAESPAEAWDAERWFQTAQTYPPSPFMSKMFMGSDFSIENLESRVDEGISRQSRDPSEIGNLHKSDTQSDDEKDLMQDDARSHISEAIPPPKVSAPKPSTLLKPTASQLAKQNRLQELRRSRMHSNRFKKPPLPSKGFAKENILDNPSQAPKRQKTEGGYLQKASGVKQEITFLHKAPQQRKEPGHGILEQSKLPRLTIPREPELRTARRARKIQGNEVQPEQSVPNTYVFKARPLNRKILEAPTLPLSKKSTPRRPEFQEFNLKTSERATQHANATPSLSQVGKNTSKPYLQSVTIKRGVPQQGPGPQLLRDHKIQNECEKTLPPSFKARPLNKKILTSRGDMGVFRSNKREVTKPIEFNFSTDKKSKDMPPTELFKKLSLAPEKHQNSVHPKSSHIRGGTNQDSKENIVGTAHSDVKVLHVRKEENHRLAERQLTCADSDGRTCDDGSQTLTYRKSCR